MRVAGAWDQCADPNPDLTLAPTLIANPDPDPDPDPDAVPVPVLVPYPMPSLMLTHVHTLPAPNRIVEQLDTQESITLP
jgi:hypothetical protein